MKQNNQEMPNAANETFIKKLQLQNELMAHLDHLLPKPINTILEKAKQLQEGIYGTFNTEQISWLSYIYKIACYLQAMMNEISNVVKITKDGLTIIPISAQEIANTSMRFIEEAANKKHLKTTLILDPAVTIIHADERYLKAILFHLLEQAVSSTLEGEISLEIRGYAEKGLLDFIVLDTGKSMEHMKKWELFSRLEDFSLFFYLTQLHGGCIFIEDVGKGIRFTVSLPWQNLTNIPQNNTIEQILSVYQKAYLEKKHERKEQMLAWIEEYDDETLNYLYENDGRTKLERQNELRERKISEIEKEDITIYSSWQMNEFRYSLSGVLGPIRMLLGEDDGPINAEQSKPLNTILENAQYFLSVINDLSDLSKIKLGQLKLRAKTTVPITAKELELHHIEESAQEKQLKLTTTLEPAVTTIQFEEYCLQKILGRLLKNVFRFTKEKGTINLTIRGDAEQGMAHFIISDTGKGMSEKEVNSLFNKQPFANLEDHPKIMAWTPDKFNEDLNLNLSIVYHLVTLNCGRISATSEIGKGSCFTVSLPWQPVATTDEL